MTFNELIEEVLEGLSSNPRASEIPRGEVKRLLNLAQREISLRIGAPRVTAVVPQTGVISGPFRLPGRYHPEGVLRVHLIEGETTLGCVVHGCELRVLSPGERLEYRSHSLYHPDHQTPALKYDRADTSLAFTPLGIEEGQYEFILHAVPADMVDGSDEPFAVLDYCEDPPIRTSGVFPGGHRVLAHHVTYELLQRLGDERWQAFYARYREMEKDLFARVSPTTVYLPGFRLEVSNG